MDISTSKVVEKIKPDFYDPTEVDQLVEAWSELCERAQKDSNHDLQFAAVEKAAIAALSSAPKEQPAGHIGHDISRMLNSFDYPTYLVSSDGHIVASNLCAWKEYSLEDQDSINQLPFKIDGSEKISQLIKAEVRQDNADRESALLLKRTHASEGQQDATVAITISYGRVPTALVFVITTKWKTKSVKLLKEQFGLTKTELAILISFVDGYSSQDIAKQRQRSHETVRVQFQSIRDKLQVKTQTELLRTILSVSNFTRDISEITSAVEHPHRRKSINATQRGRLVEVTLMGDLAGDPMLTLANAANYTFNADVEQQLFDANLYIISVVTPGCGRTDPVPAGEARLNCISADVNAVLDQLGVMSCPMFVYNANAPVCYGVVRRAPERFTHVAHIAACAPIRFQITLESQSPWVTGILKASVKHPAMKRVLFLGTMKAWAALGAKQFMRLQMSSNPVDAKYALAPENISEFEHALETATQGGVSSAADDLALTFEDWTPDVETIPQKITLLHGAQDKLVTIDFIREFASAFPEKIKMKVIEKAGFPLLQSHPNEVIKLLRSVVDAYGLESANNDRLCSAD